VNTILKRIVVGVASGAGLWAFSSLAACSSTNDPAIAPAPPGGGSPAGGNDAGGMPAASGAGGAAAGNATAGAGGAGKCPGNQIMMGGKCACPAYAPTFCDAIMKCVNQTKDPEHCGACEKACGATQACSASACAPELMPFGESAGCGGKLALLTTTDKLFVLNGMAGTLSSIALASGGAATPVASALTGASAFTLDATNAYVVTGTSVTRVTLAGGAKAAVVQETGPIYDVALDTKGNLFYTQGKEVRMVLASATMGTGTKVAEGIDEGEPQGVVVSADTVLYASASAFNVESDPVASDMHVKIGASQGSLFFGHRSVQADATHVYWANGGLQSASFVGADHTGKSVGAPVEGNVTAYAINSTSKTSYFASDTGNFEKSAFDAEMPTAIARGLGKVSSVVLDGTSFYLATPECKILKGAQ
jgi:hypothetical protein